MNPKIDPEIALKRVNAFLEEIENKKLLEKNYMDGSEELDRIRKEIEGLLRAMFHDPQKRINEYYDPYTWSGMTERDKQDKYISEVKKVINNLLSLKKELKLYIDSKSIQGEIEKEIISNGAITQHFHGNVENLALGDIKTYNTNIYFDALIKAIEESDKIHEEDKKSLIDKIKTIAHDPYVAGIGASAIFEGIKALSMGVKPF